MKRTSLVPLLIAVLLLIGEVCAQVRISRAVYEDRLRAFWLAQCIANWTGLQTECARCSAPFFTDTDWSRYGYILNQNPWLADDDTDIEYVYCHLLQKHNTTTLTPEQIRQGWIDHINRYIWVSNETVRGLFNQGILPPATSLPAANGNAFQIDAQLTTEVFGALAPGMPHKALEMANLPILTTAFGHAAHASQFFVLLHSLAMLVDTTLSGTDQVVWLVREARKYFPDSSKVSHMVDFVLADYLANPDKDDWERTRDRIHQHYQTSAQANGWRFIGCVESSVNFAAGINCLLYGGGDYKKTVRIGTLGGWDSDNPTATMAGLLGLIHGYNKFVAHLDGRTFSDRYNIYRTRDNLPDYLPNDQNAEDTFSAMARRMLTTIDKAVVEAGGSVDPAGYWVLPPAPVAGVDANPLLHTTKRSANIQVRRQGGTVTPGSSIAGSSLNAIVDGIEHTFGGKEYFGPHPQFSAQGAELMLSVTYDRDVEVHTVRFVKGGSTTGYTGATIEVLAGGQWREPTGGAAASHSMNASQRYQIVDFILAEPLSARGIRIRGPLNGRCDVLELDALSKPLSLFYDPTPPAAPGNLAATGVSYDQRTLSWSEASDPESGIGRYLIYRNNQLLGATTTTQLTDSGLTENTTYTYHVSAVNGSGTEGQKASVTTTTPPDRDPPRLIGASAHSETTVRVLFSEPLEKGSAESAGNYAIDRGVSVVSAALQPGGRAVLLITTTIERGVSHTLTVNGVKDASLGKNAIAPGSRVEFIFRIEWHSWNAVFTGGSPQATVVNQGGGLSATLELYESTTNNSITKGTLLSVFRAGEHPETFNKAATFWANTTGNAYSYVGKSTVARGQDAGETNTPQPLDVYDITVHPPDNDRLVVVAFIAPEDGFYSVLNLGVRRVHDAGGSSTYKVLGSDANQVRSLTTAGRAWVTDEKSYEIGNLTSGQSIYFAVDRDGDYSYDATEICWTVTMGTSRAAVKTPLRAPLSEARGGGVVRVFDLQGKQLLLREYAEGYSGSDGDIRSLLSGLGRGCYVVTIDRQWGRRVNSAVRRR